MAGTAPQSFVATLINDSLRHGTLQEDERDIISAASSVYGGLLSVLYSSFYSMLRRLSHDSSWI